MKAPRGKKPAAVHPYMGPNVRWYRKMRGLTGPQLAERAGIAKGFLSQVETGKANLSYERALVLAAALGVPVELIWDHRPPPPDKFERPPRRRQ